MGQRDPFGDFLFAALLFDHGFEREGVGIGGIELNGLLDFAQGERVLGGLEEAAGAFEHLADAGLADGLIDLAAEAGDFLIEVAFGFQFGEHFGGEGVVAGFETFGSAFETGLDLGAIETFERLVAEGLLERVGKLAHVEKAVPGLLRHGLVNDLAD